MDQDKESNVSIVLRGQGKLKADRSRSHCDQCFSFGSLNSVMLRFALPSSKQDKTKFNTLVR